MDKYEFNIKVEQIKKMVSKGDYETAMKIADTIDWRRVRNVNILSMVATIYEKNEVYQEAKDILLLAFERAPIGKRLLFKLAELAIKEGSVKEAEDYYREFCDLSPDDPRQYILRYMILGAKGAPVEQLIHTLEQYCNIELDEKWLYELAELYAEAGMGELCVMACDKIMLMFGLGKYVEKAMELKIQFAPLTKYQMDLVENRDKYEAKLRAVEDQYRMGRPAEAIGNDGPERPEAAGGRPFQYTGSGEAAYTREPGYEGEYGDGPSYSREAVYTREPGYEDLPEYGEEPGYGGDEGYMENAGYGGGYGYADQSGEARMAGYAREPGGGEEGYAEAGYTEDGYGGEGYTKAGYAEDGYSGEGYTKAGYDEEGYAEEAEYAGAYDEYGPEHEEDEPAHTQVTIEPEEPEAQQEWMPEEPPDAMTDKDLKARMHEAEVQANLAMEMNRISVNGFKKEVEMAQTRVLSDIRDINKSPVKQARHLMIEAETPQQGLEMAIESLKKIHKETGAKNQAAKITGEKMNAKGVFNISDKLTGKDLIIESAGYMTEPILQELNQLMARDETGMNVVLIDTAKRLEALYRIYPGLAKRFEYIGPTAPLKESEYEEPKEDRRPVRQVQPKRQEAPQPQTAYPHPEQAKQGKKPGAMAAEQKGAASVPERKSMPPMPEKKPAVLAPVKKVKEAMAPEEEQIPDDVEMDIDDFAKYACGYASDIDCSISGKSMLALYERIEIMEEDGIPLTKANAEDLIEEAADNAENPSFFKRITGIFSSKYDKDGLLILKEEHFI